MKPVGAKPWADGVQVGAVGAQAGLQERQLREVHLWWREEGGGKAAMGGGGKGGEWLGTMAL